MSFKMLKDLSVEQSSITISNLKFIPTPIWFFILEITFLQYSELYTVTITLTVTTISFNALIYDNTHYLII